MSALLAERRLRRCGPLTLKQYFETASGTGVLSTADAGGKVDAAIYSTPHVMDDGTVAFITAGAADAREH